MDKNLHLPEAFFTDQSRLNGLLWLPNLEENRLSQKIDWLSGLSLSRGYYRRLKPWHEKLEKIIEKKELTLDKNPEFNSLTIIFKLPRGFKASMGLIIKDCAWDSPDHVFAIYSKHSKDLNPDFIQSPYIWPSQPSQLLKEVQWINI